VQSPASYPGFATNMVTNSEHRVRIPYARTSVKEHVDDLRKQAENPHTPVVGKGEKAVPMQHVVFVNRQARLLLEALGNPNHPNRREAQQAIRRFTLAVEKPQEKPQGMTMNSAAQEFNVPRNFLWRWSKQRRVIPILEEGTGIGSPTYLDREKAQEVAEIYHEAKRQGKQPKKLLEEKYPESSKASPK
jgi:hypothetical protein